VAARRVRERNQLLADQVVNRALRPEAPLDVLYGLCHRADFAAGRDPSVDADYRPRAEILSGLWQSPEARLVQ
jgi:hypothetical protein